MQDYELDAWLGGTEVTDEQRAALLRISGMVAARYPDPDEADDREAAFAAAAQVVLGDTAWTEPITAWQDARRREIEAHAGMTGAVMAAVEWAGITEYRVTRISGLARATVRKALASEGA